jgi:hypothetical protein
MTSHELEREIRAYRLCSAAEPHTKVKPCDKHRAEAVQQMGDVARVRHP